jgi:AcrR family transcriptional regulator
MPVESSKKVVEVDGRRRRPWALASQENLLNSAIEEIAASGFERARLSDIAKRAGMTPGSIYTWFENKEDLFQAALQHALSEQLQKNQDAHDKAGIEDSFLRQIAALVPRNYQDSAPTNAQQLLIECYYAAWRDPKAREKLLGGIESQLQMYIAVFEDGQQQGLVTKEVSAAVLGTFLLSIHTGLAMLSLAGAPRISDPEWVAMYTRIADAFRAK